MYHPEGLEPIVTFLRGIGVGVEFGAGAEGGFLPGSNVRAGVLHVDPDRLPGAGDLLHEAGHIIMVPRRLWPRLNRDLQADIEALAAEEAAKQGSASPVLAHAVQMGEFMSQAWSYAVLRRLGLPQECVFFPGSYSCSDYKGLHPMLAWLERGTHYGPMALAQVGMTGFSGIFGMMHSNGLPAFPEMARWTLD